MKKLGKVLLWILAIIGALVVIFTIIIASAIPTRKPVTVEDNSFLEIEFSGMYNDYNVYSEMPFVFEKISVGEICRKLESAKDDSRIKGIVLKPKIFYSAGWGLTRELREKLIDFKKSGKKIYAYIDIASDKGYYLSSIADSIFLNPATSGGIALGGIAAEISFYKGLLDKIGIEFTVVHQGKYKGAGETLSRETISEPMKENYSEFVEDMYGVFINDVAEGRGLTVEEMKDIMENREDFWITEDRAIELDLVDVLASEKEFTEAIIGDNPVLKIEKYPAQSSDYSKDKIAVLYAQGSIVMAGTEPFSGDYRVITEKNITRELERIQKRKSIKALVFRVNSGGGSALVSDIIWKELEKVNEKIPVVVSMGDVAASGGYYVSCGADYVFAQPNTLTGSIGVVSIIPNWEELRKKVDINTYQIKRGKYSTFLSPNFSPSEEDMVTLTRYSEKVYDEFKEKVSKGRKMSIGEVESIAQGRIWSGKRAVKVGLVDEIGGLDKAIKKAAELAQIEDYSVIVYPSQKGLLDLLKEREIINVTTARREANFPYNVKNERRLLQTIINEPIQLITPVKIVLN